MTNENNDIITEEWRMISDFPNYEVSNLGKIRNIHTMRVLTPGIHKIKGYYICNLTFQQSKIRKTVALHILIAHTFISNPNKKKYVLHKESKLNNCVDNLFWSRSSRINHKSSVTDESIKEIVNRLKNGEKGSKLALEYNTSEMTISRINKKHKTMSDNETKNSL